MNKRQKPSKSRRGAGITLAVCFVAAAVMVGTYTLRNYQEARQQEQALAEENARTKEKESQEEAGSSLVINTEEDPADGAAARKMQQVSQQTASPAQRLCPREAHPAREPHLRHPEEPEM